MIELREITSDDWDWVVEAAEPIGGAAVISGGFLHRLRDHEGFLALENDVPVGFIVYASGGVRWEILGMLSVVPRNGVGTLMLEELERKAREAGASQLRLSTTNDNFPALRFCQLRGYQMRQLIPGAMIEAKKLKGIAPDIPLLGLYGIEIRDEIILNKNL